MSIEGESYITLLPNKNKRKAQVIVLRYRRDTEDYRETQRSNALPLPAARYLAQSWASALHLEVR